MLTSEQEEAVPESLKNILLVMSTSGYLVPKSEDPNQEKLWFETWKRLDRFLPDLRKQLNLDIEEEVKPQPNTEEASPPPIEATAGEERETHDAQTES